MLPCKAPCLLLLLAIIAPVSANQAAVKETASSQLMQLSIGLEPESRAILERTLYNISDPTHRQYGKHITREEAKALLQPRRGSTDAVKRWLSQAGVSDGDVLDQGQFIHAHVAVQLAESLLGTQLNARARRGERGVRTEAASLPAVLRQHIATIRSSSLQGEAASHEIQASSGRVTEGQRASYRHPCQSCHRRDEAPVDLEKCKSETTPACLSKLYNMGEYHAKPTGKSHLGVAGFDNQSAQYDQFERFLDAFSPCVAAAGANFSVELINGGGNPQGDYPSTEANVDIQYAVAMAYNVPVRYYSTGGENHDIIPDLDLSDSGLESVEPFLEFASYMLDLDDNELPGVISISYGVNEQTLPKRYATQVCDMFGQLGARGVSIVVASGDDGPGASCQSNDGKKRTKFLPSFPASCPYVTSVGATESNRPEVAANFSSGGFSEYFSRPEWQDATVGEYLREHGDQWKAYYNPDGRAYPDVAVNGKSYQAMSHGNLISTDGTSASAPTFAAIIALLNDYRATSNKPPMGFLNPWIYRIGRRGFTDITGGKSMGCSGQSRLGLASPEIPGAGWSAVPGWDPATGWGTPLFDLLKSLSSGWERHDHSDGKTRLGIKVG